MNSFVRKRRALLNKNMHLTERLDPKAQKTGLAFSGGGIRSATVSLGIVQALVKHGRFYGFDLMSTVSGGGYFGSFLRSLYLPDALRGKAFDDQILDICSPSEAFLRADRVLRAGPNVTEYLPTGDGVKATHPLRWLRENGRYLAPNGMTDYASAASYAVRGWLAITMILAVGWAMFWGALQNLLLLFDKRVVELSVIHYDKFPLSPLVQPIAFLLALSLGSGLAYWLTAGMSYSPGRQKESLCSLSKYLGLAATSVIMLIVYISGALGCPYLPGLAQLPPFARWCVCGVSAIIGIATLCTLVAVLRSVAKSSADNLTPPLRRTLLQITTYVNIALLVLAILAAMDSASIGIREGAFKWIPALGLKPFWVLILHPLLSYLTKTVPGWLEKTKIPFLPKILAQRSLIALITGITMLIMIGIGVDVITHMALWQGKAWTEAADIQTWMIFCGFTFVIGLALGCSAGIVNLTALYGLYSSRLTRTFLGGSNFERLEIGKNGRSNNVTQGHPKDHVDARLYMQATVAAPIHLVNLTVNQTAGPDTLVARDRKGRRFVVGPAGIRVDGERLGWPTKEHNAEPFNVGQLCAISGAAASSAMGRRTTLGGALTLTQTNVRLGQWWDRGDFEVSTAQTSSNQTLTLWERIGRSRSSAPIRTFFYLINEMIAYHSLNFKHVYLSDGGHSENSGVLALIEEDCRFILAVDNSEDPDFDFGDLEILIRTARTDIGYEVHVARKQDSLAHFGLHKNADLARSFLNVTDNWRKAAREEGQPGYALHLIARKIVPGGVNGLDEASRVDIIWLKPRIFEGLSSDIATYAKMNPPFPHQPVFDQSFDEAQWESYRRMGFEMARRLFERPHLIKAIPYMLSKSQHAAAMK